jgi:hypothetical protein
MAGMLVSDIVSETKAELVARLGQRLCEADGDYADTDTSITLARDLATLGSGTQLCVERTGELLHVWDRAGQVVTVRRGMHGTEAAAIEDGDLIEVAARFPTARILTAIERAISTLPPSLFRELYFDEVVECGATFVDVGETAVLWILDARADADIRRDARRDHHPETRGCKIERVGPLGESFGISVPSVEYARRFYFVFGVPFDPSLELTMDTDLEHEVGLTKTMRDIPMWAACADLIRSAEIERLDTNQPNQPTDQQTVPAISLARLASQYDAMYEKRVAREQERLRMKWPYKIGSFV